MDYRDIMNAELVGKTLFERWKRSFEKEMYEPIAKLLLAQALYSAKFSPKIDQSLLRSRLSPKARQRFDQIGKE